jgi:hypothetical protein
LFPIPQERAEVYADTGRKFQKTNKLFFRESNIFAGIASMEVGSKVMADENGQNDQQQAPSKKTAAAVVTDIRVSFIGKDAKGKEKHVALHVHGVEKSLSAIAGDKRLASLADDIEELAGAGADLLARYEDAHNVEVSKAGFQDGSKTYPFKAAAEAE